MNKPLKRKDGHDLIVYLIDCRATHHDQMTAHFEDYDGDGNPLCNLIYNGTTYDGYGPNETPYRTWYLSYTEMDTHNEVIRVDALRLHAEMLAEVDKEYPPEPHPC